MTTDSLPSEQKFIQIDEQGYILFGELRVSDADLGKTLLESMKFTDNGIVVTEMNEEEVIVEAFDQPLVALQVDHQGPIWQVRGPYQTQFNFDINDLTLDEWDRFHGRTSSGLPFVFSRPAQAQFFNFLEEYSDDSFTVDGKVFYPGSYLLDNPDIGKAAWWTQVYHKEGNPRWNLAAPAEPLKEMLPRLKLPKSKILVLGCGEGHDAAFFAKDGHRVVAVDISEEALQRAQKQYGHLSTLEFVQRDLFNLGSEFKNSFDLVFEHTCYCAVNPSRRNELVKIWNQCLMEGGSLLGVFYVTEKRSGPPFGASEWEVRERLKKNHQFLFWGRWRQSIPRRLGKELFVYTRKRS